MLLFLLIAAIGVLLGYITLKLLIIFHETFEARVSVLLLSILIDVIVVMIDQLYAASLALQITLIFKYFFLSIINFEKALSR